MCVLGILPFFIFFPVSSFFSILFSHPGFQRLRKGRVTSAGRGGGERREEGEQVREAYHAILQSYRVG